MFRNSVNRWGKLPAVFMLLVTVLFVAAAAPKSMVADNDHQSDEVIVIEVSTVEELYEAVYDENALPREQVEIRLAPGEYELSPANDRPNNGRLHLGPETNLMGPLVLTVDDQGIPVAIEETPDPGVEAIINFGGLTSFFGYGAIVVDGGTVEGVTLMGDGATPGIEIASNGLVRGNRIENSSLGVRIRASASDPVHGIVEGNLVQNGYFIGLSIIAAQPLVAEVDCNLNGTIDFGESAEPGASNTRLQAEVYRNRFEAGERGLQVLGSFGGSFNTLNVTAADNVVAKNSEAGVWVIGGWDNFLAPDCIKAVQRRDATNNQVIFKSQRLRVADSPTGILVAGSVRSTDAAVSDHRVHAEFDDTTLVGTDTGLRLLGEDLVHVGQDAPLGERSRVDLVIVRTKAETPEGESTTISSVVDNCRDDSTDFCSNIVSVTGRAQTFAQENPGLNSDDFLGHYTDNE